MKTDETLWQEGDLWTNDRGVTFRLECHSTPIGPVRIWVKQHYRVPKIVAGASELVAQPG